MFEMFTTVVHVLACFFLILVVLLQSGKGGGLSGAFGGGAGAAMGQASAGSVLTKLTGSAAAIFMVTSMVLAIYSSPSSNDATKDFADRAAATEGAAADSKTPELKAPASDAKTPASDAKAPASDAK
jgi:preprotein translocase subunit SecG